MNKGKNTLKFLWHPQKYYFFISIFHITSITDNIEAKSGLPQKKSKTFLVLFCK